MKEQKSAGGLVLGVGIDMVSINEIREMIHRTDRVFERHTFTPAEQAEAGQEKDPAEYYAGRFAVKEAVFKAAAHLLEEKTFDFRVVETLRRTDGSPYVRISSELREKFQRVGIDDILVSISNERDMAIAIAQAVQHPPH